MKYKKKDGYILNLNINLSQAIPLKSLLKNVLWLSQQPTEWLNAGKPAGFQTFEKGPLNESWR